MHNWTEENPPWMQSHCPASSETMTWILRFIRNKTLKLMVDIPKQQLGEVRFQQDGRDDI